MRSRGDAFRGGNDTHLEFHLHIDTHPVLSDEAFIVHPAHTEFLGAHIDLVDPVQEWPNRNAAVKYHSLPARTGSDQRGIPSRFEIEAVEQEDAHDDHDNCEQQPEKGFHTSLRKRPS